VSGEYALEVYANDPSRDGNTYTHVCQYLLVRPDRGDASYDGFFQSPEYSECYNVYGLQEPLKPVSMSMEQLARGKDPPPSLRVQPHASPCRMSQPLIVQNINPTPARL